MTPGCAPTGYRAPAARYARRKQRGKEKGLPLMPPLAYATGMRIRVLVGSILSVAIVGGAVFLSAAGGSVGRGSVRLGSGAVPLAVDSLPLTPVPADGADATVGPGSSFGASVHTPSGIDASYVRAARTCPGLDPAVLAAIHTVETRRGKDHRVSVAGAAGPMQFLPATWAHYGVDGNGDGRIDITNFSDALFSAARYLCANGGGNPQRVPTAVWNYNHSRTYVMAVLQLARQLRMA